MTIKKFAVFGTGFWARFQIAAWAELEGVECVALYNRTKSRAKRLAQEFGIPNVYDDPEELFSHHHLDFVDIITDVNSHEHLVALAANNRTSVICQKPMAPDLAACERMVWICREADVSFFIHENWRWQSPIRRLKQIILSGVIGNIYRARIDFNTQFSVFDNQPFLRSLDRFILTDIGSHILDTSRFLFGEAVLLYCQTRRIHTDIAGEDVATVQLLTVGNITVNCNMSYAGTPYERDRYPQTYFFIEGEQGSIELGPDFTIKITDKSGTFTEHATPKTYSFADPAYAVVHSSIVDCNNDLLSALHRGARAETDSADNLRTMQLVYGSYLSASTGSSVRLPLESHNVAAK